MMGCCDGVGFRSFLVVPFLPDWGAYYASEDLRSCFIKMAYR